MKVTVTHLKAPWPAGTEPGHVVELLGVDAIPAWAVGKCVQAADDAEAAATWSPPGFVAQLVVNPASDAHAESQAAPAATPARRRAQAATG